MSLAAVSPKFRSSATRRSISFIAALPSDEQERVIAEVRAVIADTPDLVGRREVTFPYRTMAYHCVRT